MHRLGAISIALAMTVAGAPAVSARPAAGSRGSSAEADPAAQDAAALKRKAQQLLTEGNRLAAAGDFVTALLKFRAAFELYPSPRLLLNIGTSQRQLGRFADAATSYEQYLVSDEGNSDHAPAARRALDELASVVGHVVIEPPEPGARVLLDGRAVRPDELGVPVRVDPGPHTLIAEKEGRAPTVRLVDVGAQETVAVALPLAAPGESPPEPVPVRPIAGYAATGLGGAAIGVAVVLAVVAGVTDGDARDHCAAGGTFAGYCSEEGARLTNKARDFGIAAVVTGLLGAAVGISGLTIALTTPTEPDRAMPQAPTPAGRGPTVDQAGVMVRWRGVW